MPGLEIIKAGSRHRRAISHLIVSAKIGSRIRGPIRNFWIARLNGRIVGCAGLEFPKERVAIFTYLAVEREFRHQGIGSALIKHRKQEARKRRAKILALVTMYYLFRFYRKRGFQTCPRENLPELLKTYWMFTSSRYKKCAVMTQKL